MATERTVALADSLALAEEPQRVNNCHMCDVEPGDYLWEKGDHPLEDRWCFDCLAHEIWEQAVFFDEIRALV